MSVAWPLPVLSSLQGKRRVTWALLSGGPGALRRPPPSLSRIGTAGREGAASSCLRGQSNTIKMSVMLKLNHLIGTLVLKILESLLKKKQEKSWHFVHFPRRI